MMYSTGSSTVSTLTSGVTTFDNAATSVVDLPEPVGPVRMTMPCGWRMALSNCFIAPSRSPSLLRSVMTLRSSRIRQTMLSARISELAVAMGRMETR